MDPHLSTPSQHLKCPSIIRSTPDTLKLQMPACRTYVGPFQPSAFLEKYFPQRDDMHKFDDEWKKAFKLVGRLGSRNKETNNGNVEKDMYQPTVNALKDFCPGFDIEIFGGSGDHKAGVHFGGDMKLDINIYEQGSYRRHRMDFIAMETHIEMKPDDDSDGFDDDHLGGTPFLRKSDKAVSTRGQLASYAGSQMASQFHTHTFSVWATGRHARLFRWDRAGVVVSTKFDYTEESYLADFFWCLSHASREARGYDDSATVAGKSDAPHVENAKRVLGLNQDATIYKFKVHDAKTNTDKFYYGVKLRAKFTVSPVGRCTIGFEVVDEDGNKVYLEDTWRIFADGYETEGEIYEKLEGMGGLIPTVVAHGDVKGPWQQTHTQEWCLGGLHEQFRVYQHYFIMFKEAGRPLSDFRTTKELVAALRDALQAHTKAYRQGILHRDISIGNILISENGGGMLIDWDFSRPIANPEVRVMARTGTRQFMSVHLLSNAPGAVEHTVVDDVESFFHVLCYVVLVHCPHGFPRGLLRHYLKTVYDSWYLEDEDDEDEDEDNDVEDNEDGGGEQDNKDNTAGEVCGGHRKELALASLFMTNQVQLPSGPLRDLVTALEGVIAVRYRKKPTDQERKIYEGMRAKYDLTDEELAIQLVWCYDDAVKKLNQASEWMLETFNKALEVPRGLTAEPVSRPFFTNQKRMELTLNLMSSRGSTCQEDDGQASGSGLKRKRNDLHGSQSKKARKGDR